MKRLALVLLVLTTALVGSSRAANETVGFRVVANAANKETTIRRVALADMFLKRLSRWPDGTAVVPVDQSATTPVRVAFSKAILGREMRAVLAYWQEQIFSGRGTPPPVKTSDRDVVVFVQANPGALGYVSEAEPIVGGVKILNVGE